MTPYYYGVIGLSERGTLIHYAVEALPQWLSFTDNGNGTATFDGIPGAEDVGVYQIVLKGNDSILEVQQSFSIEVKSKSINGIPERKAVGMHIFPNPVIDGKLNIKLDDGINEQFDLSILDMSGKILLQKHLDQANNLTLDVSTYPPALYLIHFRSLNFEFSERFIIQ
jgi:hypothetical protein